MVLLVAMAMSRQLKHMIGMLDTRTKLLPMTLIIFGIFQLHRVSLCLALTQGYKLFFF